MGKNRQKKLRINGISFSLFFFFIPFIAASFPSVPARADSSQKEFRAKVFGRWITVKPGDPRSVTAWDTGLDISEPPPEGSEILPFGEFYIWRHPDSRTLFRAEISGVWDDIFLARRIDGPLEAVLTFTNYTVPFPQSELVDGKELKTEQLLWGYIRPGFGIGWRRQVWPGNQDNMLAADLTIEPGFLFFAKGSDTARNFTAPRDTPELRAHLQVRWDALRRNLIKLPQEGYAAGADLVYGYRPGWRDWGIDRAQAASGGREYASFAGYFLAAGGVPWVPLAPLVKERHRLIGAIYGGSGYHLDRFSAVRVGGGPNPFGEEYGSTYRPILPGSAIYEFSPQQYLLATVEYRYQPAFFACIGLDASAGWLDRFRRTGTQIVKKNDVLPAIGTRLTTGFFFDTLLQIAYNHNFGVVRENSFGGNEILINISGEF